jgi:hypothetical protein
MLVPSLTRESNNSTTEAYAIETRTTACVWELVAHVDRGVITCCGDSPRWRSRWPRPSPFDTTYIGQMCRGAHATSIHWPVARYQENDGNGDIMRERFRGRWVVPWKISYAN